ncbi:SHOCT domain-containing protein [Brevibacillus fulvus]|uniref:SHOCT domain-containing protein n=1 Tax=Brevibacillus fulvus TaxID=1125967 RepID=A0A938XZT6_9BACL|nr:SHOCT domain-containing protein [Brevibacillus fulvus]MBM7590771.1 hypothetical protein [Brevibacillus fulvus]
MARRGRVNVRPSRPASLAGVIIGIVFIFIGITQVIPTFGAFGFLWTLIACVITGMSVYQLFTNKGMTSYEIDLEGNSATGQPPGVASDFDSRMRKVESLYRDGVINREEYERKRAEIMQERW